MATAPWHHLLAAVDQWLQKAVVLRQKVQAVILRVVTRPALFICELDDQMDGMNSARRGCWTMLDLESEWRSGRFFGPSGMPQQST
ncbi:hypothetical protein UU5_16644 [Rhodanobacter sp. 115]|nr:hypothetical protein UU5_16644 [Rhodanobacter sp. 115]